MTIAKLIETNKQKFEIWDEQLEEHLDLLYSSSDYSDSERERIFYQSNQLLMSIAENFFKYGKFKDTWDNSKCYLNFLGQNLLLRSEKMNITFSWGLDANDFFLECSIMYPENLRYMNDNFWSELLVLKSLGQFEFTGSGYLNSKERPFFENKTSTIFQMVRNFMLYQTEKMDETNYRLPPSMDMGQLILKWDVNIDFEVLLEQSCKAFKALYSLNYQLWKISDLDKKAKKKLSL